MLTKIRSQSCISSVLQGLELVQGDKRLGMAFPLFWDVWEVKWWQGPRCTLHCLFFCGQACAKTVFSLQEGPCVIMLRSQGLLTWDHSLKKFKKKAEMFWLRYSESFHLVWKVWTKYFAILAPAILALLIPLRSLIIRLLVQMHEKTPVQM